MPLKDPDYCACTLIGCILVPLCPMTQPLSICMDSESNQVSQIMIEPVFANAFPFCLMCPVSTMICRMHVCGCCTQYDINEITNSFVAGGDTCFLKCYPYCFPKATPIDLNKQGTGYDPWHKNTALHFAVSELYDYNNMVIYCFPTFPCFKRRTVDYLLAKGADPTLKNRDGKTPFDVLVRKYVSDDAYEKLKAGHETAVKRQEEIDKAEKEKAEKEAVANKIAADKKEEERRQREKEAEERRKAEEQRRKEERERKIIENDKEIKALHAFLAEDCELPMDRSKDYAICFVLDHECSTVDKLRLLFVRGALTKAFTTMDISMSEQEKISQGLFASQAAPKKKSQIMPMNDGPVEAEPIVLSDCFLTHDWGIDEKERSNHSRVAKVNKYLKDKGLITWFDEDRMDGNVRRKMTEGIDNTLCMVVFITDRYRNKVNGSEDRDNCRYEFTYGVEQKGPQRMVPVVMEERMLNSREWRQELGAALATKLYVNMVSDDEAEFEARCEELYGRIRSVIGQSRKEREQV